MFARVWEVVKATLALALLIAASLISADKLDHEKAASVRGASLVEPLVTGAIPLRR